MSPVDQLPVVVVGGGTAGLSFVCEFVQHSTRPVVLYEPGPEVRDHSRRFFNVLLPEFIQPHVSAILVEGEPPVPYLQAQAFGGGSAINGMLNDPVSLDDLLFYVQPEQSEIGPVARTLINVGGVTATLAWKKNERLNDVATIKDLISSGRISVLQKSVDSLLVEDGAVVGVRSGGEEVRAAHVVLAAGVTASIDLLSAQQDLSKTFHIGENISDHPCLTATVTLKSAAPPESFDAGAYKYLQLPHGESAVVVAYERAHRDDEETGLLSVVLLSPQSRGWMESMGSEVVAHMNMLSTQADVVAMREATRELVEILLHPDLRRISDSISLGTSGVSLEEVLDMTNAELDSWLRCNLSPVSHISGGCSLIGEKIPGLSVADASAFEHVPHGFPNHFVRTFARKVGQEIGEMYT